MTHWISSNSRIVDGDTNGTIDLHLHLPVDQRCFGSVFLSADLLKGVKTNHDFHDFLFVLDGFGDLSNTSCC